MLLVLVGGVMSTNAQITESGKIKVYFQNMNNWDDVRLYVKGNDTNSTEIQAWPGIDITNNTIEIDGNTYNFYVVDMSQLNGATAITVNINNGSDEQSYDWDNIKYDVFFSIATTSSETAYGWTKYNLSRETKYYLYDTSSLSIKLDLVSEHIYGAIVDLTEETEEKHYIVADTEEGGAFNWGNGFDWNRTMWRPWGDNVYKELAWATIELSNNNCWKGTNGSDSWGFAPGFKYLFTINPIDADGNNYKFGVEPYFTRTLPAAAEGYATFSSEYDVTVPEGLTAKYASAVAGGKITWEEFGTNGIPAGQGALLEGTAGKGYKFTPATSAEAPSVNLMKAINEEKRLPQTEGSNTNYILSKSTVNGDAALGFYKVNASGSWCAAGTAYLSVPSQQAPEFIVLGETTDIANVNRENVSDNQYYTLDGRRIAQPTKGLYIVNGKKVIIK